MRLDSHNFSPAILGKIVRAGARDSSFSAAAESLADLAEVHISGRQLGRIVERVGAELQAVRDQRVEAYQQGQTRPQRELAPRLAVVSLDGGRLQVRSEQTGQGPGVHEPAWREDKVADLVTMSTQSHDQDPHPELPRCFLQKRQVVELVQGIRGQGAQADVIDPLGDAEPPRLSLFEPTPEEEPKPEPWQPKPLVRTCEASLGSSETFGPMVAAEAQRRNFFAAQSRAFLGDGAAWIWTLHRIHFPTFEPIVDFVHVMTYVYLAARAVGGPPGAVWERCCDWARACWQGRVAEVLESLRSHLETMPPSPEGQEIKPTDPSEVIRQSLGYLSHNEGRMDYPRYRREGLPVVSGLIESLVKQFNRRVKGTEKFWNPSQGEAILQLRAAQLSQDERLTEHLRTREISPHRRYESAKRRKAG